MSKELWLAMVATDSPRLPALDDLARRLQQLDPEAGSIVDPQQSGRVMTFRWGQATCSATVFPMPIPWEHVEGPCCCAWYWPQASDVMRETAAHLLISMLDEQTRDPIAKSMRFTRLVAAITDSTTAAGVFWGPGRLVHPRAAFTELAAEMSEDGLPLYLWIDFRVEETAGGGLRLFTTGMEALGHLELEVSQFQGTAEQLREAVYNVAHYILDGVKPLNDGDTADVQGRQVSVRTDHSMLDPSSSVMRLEFC